MRRKAGAVLLAAGTALAASAEDAAKTPAAGPQSSLATNAAAWLAVPSDP